MGGGNIYIYVIYIYSSSVAVFRREEKKNPEESVGTQNPAYILAHVRHLTFFRLCNYFFQVFLPS